jgi:predicted MPP superfamily phosphohydrolase
MLFIKTSVYSGVFDSPSNVWNLMKMKGIAFAITPPRVIIIIMHFFDKLLKYITKNAANWLTNAGLIMAPIVFLIIAGGILFGRFNVKVDSVEIKIEGLHKDLEGLRIVQTSDLHLAGFYRYKRGLSQFMDMISSLSPDIIINTGDFVTYGWREFNNFDSILLKAYGRYGKIAIFGNHDFGTYHPDFTEEERRDNVLKMVQKLNSSGYYVLNNDHIVVNVGDAKIGVVGVITTGRHPNLHHGCVECALEGLDTVDLKIAITHDPNQFTLAIEEKTDIDITLSGHTHGMQMGIMTKRFRWSPSKYFYPHWNGLYSSGNQYHYTNRGLGTISIPFRIWMPPEITLITLRDGI